MLRSLTDSLVFDAFIFLVVCLNTIMLVAQTFAEVEIRGGKGREPRSCGGGRRASCWPGPTQCPVIRTTYLI